MTSSTTDVRITYRRMIEGDLPAAHRLSQEVSWPHRLDDWRFVYRLGTGFVAECDDKVIGTGLCWAFGSDHGSLGMVIVSPAGQGKGIGGQLMRLLQEELGDRSIQLIATPAGQPLYERCGFVAVGAVHQHQGSVVAPEIVIPPAGERVRPLVASDSPELARLAARAAGMPRATVFHDLMNDAEGVVIDKCGELAGFAIFRRFGRGYAIGPVVAADAESAKALIAHWVGVSSGSFVRIDVHESSGLSPWLADMGLPKVDTAISMVRGEPARAERGIRQFAILNQALG